MKNGYKSFSCLVCGGANFKVYAKKNKYELLKCTQCGFLCVPGDKVNLKDHYSENYLHNRNGCGYIDYEMDKMPTRPMYVELLQKIKPYTPGKRLLDIGTANGFFLDIANECGYEALGIDINAAVVKEGRERGRNIEQGDLLEINYEAQSFDLVTGFDIIEHLPENKLRDYLNEIRRILKNNGVLLIITLNAESKWARMLGKWWNAMLPPEHISYFSANNIKLFLKENGFEVIEAKTVNKRFSFQYLFHSLYRWQRFPLWRFFATLLADHPVIGTRSIKLSIGDNMAVIAKKV